MSFFKIRSLQLNQLSRELGNASRDSRSLAPHLGSPLATATRPQPVRRSMNNTSTTLLSVDAVGVYTFRTNGTMCQRVFRKPFMKDGIRGNTSVKFKVHVLAWM